MMAPLYKKSGFANRAAITVATWLREPERKEKKQCLIIKKE